MASRHKKPRSKRPITYKQARGCITVIAELCGIAGFLLAFYIFLKGGGK